jgi:hypothetical protein
MACPAGAAPFWAKADKPAADNAAATGSHFKCARRKSIFRNTRYLNGQPPSKANSK